MGRPLGRVASVASFFVSRVDTLVDGLLEQRPGGAPAGAGPVDNARLAYERFESLFGGSRFAPCGRRGPGCSASCGPAPAPRTRPTRT